MQLIASFSCRGRFKNASFNQILLQLLHSFIKNIIKPKMAFKQCTLIFFNIFSNCLDFIKKKIMKIIKVSKEYIFLKFTFDFHMFKRGLSSKYLGGRSKNVGEGSKNDG